MPGYVLKGFYKRQLDLYQCFSVLCCRTPAWLANGAEQGRYLPDRLLASKRFLHGTRSTAVRSAGQIQAVSCVGDDVMENTEGKKYWWLQKGQDLISLSFMSMPGVSPLRRLLGPRFPCCVFIGCSHVWAQGQTATTWFCWTTWVFGQLVQNAVIIIE